MHGIWAGKFFCETQNLKEKDNHLYKNTKLAKVHQTIMQGQKMLKCDVNFKGVAYTGRGFQGIPPDLAQITPVFIGMPL